jgi:hypothetical protein
VAFDTVWRFELGFQHLPSHLGDAKVGEKLAVGIEAFGQFFFREDLQARRLGNQPEGQRNPLKVGRKIAGEHGLGDCVEIPLQDLFG